MVFELINRKHLGSRSGFLNPEDPFGIIMFNNYEVSDIFSFIV